MSSIGAFNFIRMTGPQIPALAASVSIIDRPGTNGTAFRLESNKVRAVEIETVEWVQNLGAANVSIDVYAAYKGGYYTIVDDLGRTVTNVMVVDVIVTNVRDILVSSPSGYTHQVIAIWQLKPTN